MIIKNELILTTTNTFFLTLYFQNFSVNKKNNINKK